MINVLKLVSLREGYRTLVLHHCTCMVMLLTLFPASHGTLYHRNNLPYDLCFISRLIFPTTLISNRVNCKDAGDNLLFILVSVVAFD